MIESPSSPKLLVAAIVSVPGSRSAQVLGASVWHAITQSVYIDLLQCSTAGQLNGPAFSAASLSCLECQLVVAMLVPSPSEVDVPDVC